MFRRGVQASETAQREGWTDNEIKRDAAERAAGFIPLPIDAPKTAGQWAAVMLARATSQPVPPEPVAPLPGQEPA